MKLTILGSKIRIDSIRQVIEEWFPDLTVHYILDDKHYYTEAIMHKIEKALPKTECLLFAGEVQYNIYNYKIPQNIICDYLKKDWTSLQIAFLRATTLGIDFKNVSIDSYSQSSVKGILMDLGINCDSNAPHFIMRRNFNKEYADILANEHQELYESGDVSGALTAIAPVYEILESRNIPCVYARPSTDAILKTINHMKQQWEEHQNKYGLTAIMMIQVIPKPEYSYMRRDEYLYAHEKLKVSEEVYFFSRNTNAAVISESADLFMILINKSDLINYTDGYQRMYLMNSILANTNCDINVGIGYGFHPMEAKFNALTAMDKFSHRDKNAVYVVPKMNEVIGPIHFLDKTASRDHRFDENCFEVIAKNVGISQTLLYALYSLMEKQKKNHFTSPELAKKLNLSQRSANRLLLKLENNKLAFYVGKNLTGKSGRPSDVYEIRLKPPKNTPKSF